MWLSATWETWGGARGVATEPTREGMIVILRYKSVTTTSTSFSLTQYSSPRSSHQPIPRYARQTTPPQPSWLH